MAASGGRGAGAMANGEHPYGDRDPRSLTEGEWRLLTDSRLKTLEDQAKTAGRALWTMAIGIIVGVVVFILTQGPRVTQGAAAILRSLG